MDFTSLWAWWQKYHNRVGLAIAGLIIFAVGYQAGRMASPYFSATPIVFEEHASEDHGGNKEALTSLAAQGAQLKPSPTPAVAAAVSTTAPTSSSNASSGNYVSSKNSTLYHDKRCSTVSRIAPQNQVWFETRQQAEAAGFIASACTQKYLGQ